MKPILLFGAQYDVLQYMHKLTHWEPDKVVLCGKKYLCQLFFTIIQKVYSGCNTYLKYHIGKSLHSSQGSFSLLTDPFKTWQIDFMQISPSQVYHLLLFACSHTGFHTFPCRRTMTQLLEELLLERVRNPLLRNPF